MEWPSRFLVGVSRDRRMVAIANRLGVRIKWSHTYVLFTVGHRLELFEANWRGVGWGLWDRKHQADGWAWYSDDRATPEDAARLYAYCKGMAGKFYGYHSLVGLAVRLASEAWRRLAGGVRALAGATQVCSSLVESGSQAIFGEGYAQRPTPSPDEIVSSPHLHLEAQG